MRVGSTILALVVIAGGPAGSAAQDMFAVSWTGLTYSLDSATGAGALVGPTGFSMINSMTIDASGTVYAATKQHIVTLDKSTGTAVPIATMTLDVRGMAIDANGLIHLVVDGSPDVLWTFDPATLALTMIGGIHFLGIQALAFAPNGTLYAWDVGGGSGKGDGLLTIHPGTGAGTDVNPGVGSDASVANIQFLSVRSDGTIFGGCNELYTIDATAGTTTLIGSGGYADLRGGDFSGPCPASAGNYGDGFPGTNGIPGLSLNGSPVINSLVTLSVGNSSGAPTQVLLVAGSTPATIPGFWGGDLLLVPLVAVQLPLAGPGFVLPVTIPNDPLLCGAVLYVQGLQSDPGAASGVSSSRGLEIHFGM